MKDSRRTAEERKQDRALRAEASLALEAILAGGSWDQLPAEGVLALSHRMGNGALADLFARRDTGPETAACPTAWGDPGGEPLRCGGGAPETLEAPAFGSFAAPDAAPLSL